MSHHTLDWPTVSQSESVLEGVFVNSVGRLSVWVGIGGMLALVTAWGVGANDVANSVATSVGSRALRLRYAILVALVCETLGASLLGARVINTVKGGILRMEAFDPNLGGAANGPELLLIAFVSSLAAVALFLISATYFCYPVSTTHSLVGAVVGAALAYRGRAGVVWVSEGRGLKKLDGFVGIILAWVTSPLIAAMVASFAYCILYSTILVRRNALLWALRLLPVFLGGSLAFSFSYFVYNGSPRLHLSDDIAWWCVLLYSLAFGVGVTLLTHFLFVPWIYGRLEVWQRHRDEMRWELAVGVERRSEKPGLFDKVVVFLKKFGFNLDLPDGREDIGVDVISLQRESSENVSPKTEEVFKYWQIITAMLDAVAHGANDVANAIAPFAAILDIVRQRGAISEPRIHKFKSATSVLLNGTTVFFEKGDYIPNGRAFCGVRGNTLFYSCVLEFPNKGPPQAPGALSGVFSLVRRADNGSFVAGDVAQTCFSNCTPGAFSSYMASPKEVPWWIPVVGGIGIALGLAMWGYRVIIEIGERLVKLTPSRGVAIEIGAAVVVLAASHIGLPVSTTHCQVGATVGVGYASGRGNVNVDRFLKICAVWVVTVVFTGAMSAAVFYLLTSSPQSYDTAAELLDYCPGERLFIYDEVAKGYRGVACSGR